MPDSGRCFIIITEPKQHPSVLTRPKEPHQRLWSAAGQVMRTAEIKDRIWFLDGSKNGRQSRTSPMQHDNSAPLHARNTVLSSREVLLLFSPYLSSSCAEPKIKTIVIRKTTSLFLPCFALEHNSSNTSCRRALTTNRSEREQRRRRSGRQRHKNKRGRLTLTVPAPLLPLTGVT